MNKFSLALVLVCTISSLSYAAAPAAADEVQTVGKATLVIPANLPVTQESPVRTIASGRTSAAVIPQSLVATPNITPEKNRRDREAKRARDAAFIRSEDERIRRLSEEHIRKLEEERKKKRAASSARFAALQNLPSGGSPFKPALASAAAFAQAKQ